MREVEEMRETKEECLMVRLSRFEERKESDVEALVRKVFWGARGWMEFDMRAWRRAVADGFWGACWIEVSYVRLGLRVRGRGSYHFEGGWFVGVSHVKDSWDRRKKVGDG